MKTLNKYEFDISTNSFRKVSTSVGRTLWRIMVYIFVTVTLSILIYFVFSTIVSTDEEKKLAREVRMYRYYYTILEKKEKVLSDAIISLEARDNGIYGDLFSTDAPSADPLSFVDIIASSDSLSDSFYISYSESKMGKLELMASRIEENMRHVTRHLEDKKDLPPMSLPIVGMTYAQIGASVGMKTNPFLKVESQHSGLDIIVHQGEPVVATADGKVVDVIRSGKGLGNVVTIDHGNGYVTRYGFLSDITVSRGQNVKRGRRIGKVGITRTSFAPHLHYEVLKDGIAVDPVHCFAASVTPYEYANMLYLSASTGQSME